MAPTDSFVIVGAGLAGAKAAESLRAEGFDGRVLLLGEEPDRPYERPPLSKQYLRGEKGFEQAAVHSAEFYNEQDIELRTSTKVTAIDPATQEVTLESRERIRYERLLIATGVTPRRLRVAGSDLGGVYYLRTLSDANDLRRSVTGETQVVVIGAGWIGAEVAASCRQLGAVVSIVEPASVPLERVLGRDVGRIYADLHAAHGVNLHFGAGVEALLGSRVVEAVRLMDGTVLPAEVVVVGIGVEPRIEVAAQAGIPISNGIMVDEFLRTGVPSIYAAGDVANVFHPRYGTNIRLEHWSAALNQGPVAARNMLGDNCAYDRTPFFYSDQYDFGMEYRGWAPSYDQVVIRGDGLGREFLAFWLQDDRVLAAMNANIWDVADSIEGLLRAGGRIDPSVLADTEVDLENIVSAAGS